MISELELMLTGGANMKRLFKLICLFMLGLAAGLAGAQTTTITGTIVDPTGQHFAGGTLSYVFVNAPNFSGQSQWQGANVPAVYLTPQITTLDNTGAFTVSGLPSSTAIAPSGSTWRLTACPNATFTCTTVNVAISGASQDVGATINAATNAIKTNGTMVPLAYADSQVQTVVRTGSIYYNTAQQIPKYFDGLIWHSFGSSGGSPPGGVNTEVQTNVGGTTFGGSGTFINFTGPNPNYEITRIPIQTNSYNSTALESGTTANYFSNGSQCMQDVVTGGGITEHDCNFVNDFAAEPGVNYGTNLPGSPTEGWTVHKGTYYQDIYSTPGIDQAISVVFRKDTTGDGGALYAYCYSKGGNRDAAGEGITCIKANGVNTGFYYYGTAIASGTNLSSVTPTIGAGADFPTTDEMMADASAPIVGSDYIVGMSGYTLTSAGTHAISSAFGTANAQLNVASNPPNGTSGTISVHFAGGSDTQFRMGTAIVVSCVTPDWIMPTAVTPPDGSGNQNITANFHTSVGSGCGFYQGTINGGIDFLADNQSSGNFKILYWIVGARTTNTYDYNFVVFGSQQQIPPAKHNFGYGFTATTLTRSANVTTTCGYNAAYYLNGAQAILVSGAADSSYNGTRGPVTGLSNGCVSWPDPGTSGSTPSATISIGGTVGTCSGATWVGTNPNGLGCYTLYPMAHINHIGTTSIVDPTTGATTLTFNGTSYLDPNTMTVTVGDTLFSPYDPAAADSQIEAEGVYMIPPSGANEVLLHAAAGGDGVQGFNFALFSMYNTNDYNRYLGSGQSGLLSGPNAMYITGPYQNQMYWQGPPLSNGYHDFIGRSPYLGSGPSNQFQYYVQYIQGGSHGDAYTTWDQNLSIWSLQNNGTGITLSPTAGTVQAGPFLSTGDGGQMQSTSFYWFRDGGSIPCRPADPTFAGINYALKQTSLPDVFQYCGPNSSGTNFFAVSNATQQNVTLVMPVTPIAANSCTAPVNVVFNGATPYIVFEKTPTTNPTAVVGWGSSAGLDLKLWPTTGTNDSLSWSVCNITASSITPGALSYNVGAR